MALKRMGMIGGVGPAATVLYYQSIMEGTRARNVGDHYPELLIHSLDLGEVNTYFNQNDLVSLTEKLVTVVSCFESAGCEFAFMACNAMHMVFEDVRERINLPMVSLIDAVLVEVQTRGLSRVGIMGTTFVIETGLYRKPLEELGISCIQPDESEQDWIMEAILGDLQSHSIPEGTIHRLLYNVEQLGTKGAESIILACTDLPVAITEKNSPIPVLDTTQVHVSAILDFASGSKETQSGGKKRAT